jgi:uncharacterized UPF0160 family protein
MLTIGTHDGTFHCDEALGVFLLRLTDTWKDAQVVRTRDAEKLKTCDAVLDVGGVYDPGARWSGTSRRQDRAREQRLCGKRSALLVPSRPLVSPSSRALSSRHCMACSLLCLVAATHRYDHHQKARIGGCSSERPLA